MKLLAVVVFLAWASSAHAQLCSTGVSANSGDTISGVMTLVAGRRATNITADVVSANLGSLPITDQNPGNLPAVWSFGYTAVGDDVVSLVIVSGSSRGWSCSFSNMAVIPGLQFVIMPPLSKQTYHNIGRFLSGFGAGVAIVAQGPCSAGDALTCVILGTTGILSGFTGGLLLQVDPWDDAYGVPYDASYPSADDLGLTYLPAGAYGNPFWDTIANDNNVMASAAINLYGNLTAANISINRASSCNQIGDSCADWQAERAREFLEAANQNAYDAAAAMWELAYQYGQQGFGADYIDQWNQGAGQFYEMNQNGVR